MKYEGETAAEVLHTLHFKLKLDVVEQQIGGSHGKILAVVFGNQAKLGMEGGVVTDARTYAVQMVFVPVVVKIRKVYADFFRTYGHVFGGGDVESAEIAVACGCGDFFRRKGIGVGTAQYHGRHILPKLPFLQCPQTEREVAVLVGEAVIAVACQAQSLGVEKRADVSHFEEGEERGTQVIIVCMIEPRRRCKFLVHEVASNHESLVALHLGSRGVNQSRGTQRPLRRGGNGEAA